MQLLKKLGTSLALSLSLLSIAHADATQTISTTGTDQYWDVNPWRSEIGRVTLEYGVQSIVGLTVTSTLVDQGWGGQASTNGLFVELLSNNNAVYSLNVIGSTHDWQTVTYSLTANPSAYSDINAALAAIDRSAGPIQLSFFTVAWGYPGWELHTRDDLLTISTSLQPVPEPETYAMLLLGMGAIVLVRRRKERTAA